MSKLKFIVDGIELSFNREKVSLKEIADRVKNKYPGHICMGIINGKLYDLNRKLYRDAEITFLDTTTEDGKRLYFRGLSLLLVLASKMLFNNCEVFIKHSLSDGLYCELDIKRELSQDDIVAIKKAMKEIVDSNYPISCNYVPNDLAIEIFEKIGRKEKSELLKYRKEDLTRIYECNGYLDYFYGYMFPSTGYIKDFDVQKMADGLIVMGPKEGLKGTITEFKELPKLSDVYRESERWSETLGIFNVVDLNKIIENNQYGEMIRTVEALHEKKIAEIADTIVKNKSRVILIAAPSSSGKTSFAHRLSTQLRVNGLEPIPISIDDYFVERENTPLDEFGNMDFESIYSICIDDFNRDVNSLLSGDEIEKIKFDFITGTRIYTGETIKLDNNQPIILEGIHALNPILTEDIDDSTKFRIYLSAITQVNLDNHNRIPTTDLRLIRRMVRDYHFRGFDADKTLELWPSVRRGEKKNIFPFQEQADVMFNSVSVYELSVLKNEAMKILKEIEEGSKNYLEATRIKKILQYFEEIEDFDDIGPTSIIREFIGGSRIV